MSGRQSTVSRHPARVEIDRQLREGVPAMTVARDHGLSRQAMDRHKSKLLNKSVGTGDDERAQMLRRVQNLYNGVLGLIQAAHDEKNPGRFLKGIAEARRCLALLSRVVGLLNETPPAPVAVTVNVNIEELQQVILVALTPYPEARQAVASALIEHHDRQAGGDA